MSQRHLQARPYKRTGIGSSTTVPGRHGLDILWRRRFLFLSGFTLFFFFFPFLSFHRASCSTCVSGGSLDCQDSGGRL